MENSSLHALVFSHVSFEDLGSLKKPLQDRGFSIQYVDVAKARFSVEQANSCNLLVVLGGPVSVYEQDEYPFLKDEIACITRRLESRRPMLGICLGAQLMAAALGAKVYPGPNGKEIGWSPIIPSPASQTPEWFSPLLAPGLSLFHWHGDTFDLPAGAMHLASSNLYDNQAFAVDKHAFALQFHPEVNAADLESWYVGHAAELHHDGISVIDLRAAAREHSPRLQQEANVFWDRWLNYIL